MSKAHRKRKSKCSKSRSQSIASGVIEEGFGDELSKENYAKLGPTFSIKTSKLMGRYMVAARELKPGSVILSELPLVVGPCSGCKAQCIGCYQVLVQNGPYSKCDKCGWPLCSQKCPGLGKFYGHAETECAVLAESKSGAFLEYEDFSKLKEHFNAVVPLRCLILKESDPKKYETIMSMEPHNEIRKNIPELWNLDQRVVDRIRGRWGLDEFSEEEVHSVCGILEVNSFEIGQHGTNIRGLYPTAFLMSHDCVPNTNHSDEEKDYRLTVRASTHIRENYPITLSYAYTLQSTLKRREHLLENKFFECQCARCKDPTELGTFIGALRCPKCRTGLVLSDKPLDPEASWSCNNVRQNPPEDKCPGYTVTANSMQLLIRRISSEVDSIDCNDIKTMESFLEKYRNVLHPTHYLCLSIKLSLSQLYGKINGYLIHELSEKLLQRKTEVCREILKVFDVVEPGYTRIRGVTLYELHAPLMILTSRQFENRTLSKAELRQKLKEVVRYLEEASAILRFEPEASPEGIMGVAAKEALVKMKDWEKIIGKL